MTEPAILTELDNDKALQQSDPELAAIRDQLRYLSGGGKKLAPGMRRNGIYCTMTLPGLEDMVAVRDTKMRYEDFKVPESLTGVTWIDVGSNVGATALEAARRGATVTGVEFREDRVALCNVMARRWGLNASFHQADFNQVTRLVGTPDALPWMSQYDVVWATAVDNYIDDRPAFYRMLHSLVKPGGMLRFECNVRRGGATVDEATAWLMEAGFELGSIKYLGTGSCPFLKRKIYEVLR